MKIKTFFNIKDFNIYANNFAQVKSEKENLDLAKYVIYHSTAYGLIELKK